MQGKYPTRLRELPWEKVENAYLLVDKENNKSITLDVISFLVWTQCDGETDVDKIAGVFSMAGNEDIVKASIAGVLEKLEADGLIKWN